jgi:hypothetical protein
MKIKSPFSLVFLFTLISLQAQNDSISPNNFYVYNGLAVGVECRIPMVTKFIQLSEDYSALYKDIAGNAISSLPSLYSDSNVHNSSSHFGLEENTSVSVSFRIR